MKTIKLILKWIYGIGFSIAGLVIVFSITVIGGLLFIIGGLILFPPTLKIIEDKIGKPLSRTIRYFGIIASIFVGIIFIANKQEDKDNEKKREEQIAFEKLPQHLKDSINLAQAKQDSVDKVQKEANQKAEVAKNRKEKVEKQFNSWDGSHIKLTRYIKKNMPDPDSYKHVETKYVDKSDYILVSTEFKGRNGFGGMVFGYVTAKVDIEGNVLDIVSQK